MTKKSFCRMVTLAILVLTVAIVGILRQKGKKAMPLRPSASGVQTKETGQKLDRIAMHASISSGKPGSMLSIHSSEGFPPFRNMGQASPEAALETIMWAKGNANIEALKRCLAFDSESKAKAYAFFDTLPPETRAKFVSAEGLLAALIADAPTAVSLKILKQNANPDGSVTIDFEAEDASKSVDPESKFVFRKTDGIGWQLVYPGKVLPIFAMSTSGELVRLK